MWRNLFSRVKKYFGRVYDTRVIFKGLYKYVLPKSPYFASGNLIYRKK